MKKSRDIESLIVANLFDDATEQEREQLDDALADDSARAEEYETLEQTMLLVDKAQLRQDPGEEFWDTVIEEFENRLLAEGRQDAVEENVSALHKKRERWIHFWKPALQIGTVAAMLIVGIFIGRFVAIDSPQQQQPVSEAVPADVETIVPDKSQLNMARNGYLLNAAEQSFNRSRQVISNFLEVEPQKAANQPEMFITHSSELLALVEEISLIRESLADPRLRGYEPLMDELELIIGEIAGLTGEPMDMHFEVKALQEGIRQRDILGRLHSIRSSLQNGGLR